MSIDAEEPQVSVSVAALNSAETNDKDVTVPVTNNAQSNGFSVKRAWKALREKLSAFGK